MAAVGVTQVLITVKDYGSNMVNCTTTFTVTDTTKPTLSCPDDYTLATDSDKCSAPMPNFAAIVTASDPCGFNFTQTPSTGSTMSLGNHSVTIVATDPSGNQETCTVLLIVKDMTPPVISGCGSTQSTAVDNTCHSQIPELGSLTDNCGSVIHMQYPGNGTQVGIGTFSVTVNATDSSGSNFHYGMLTLSRKSSKL
jgi:hypothetical protein